MIDDLKRDGTELLARLIGWEMRGVLTWDTSDVVHRQDSYPSGCIEWTAQTGAGGPVRICHQVPSLESCSSADLAEAARKLVETALEVNRNEHERVEYEAHTKRIAKSLLRRKAASGIRLSGVVSAVFSLDPVQSFGADVTFEWTERGRVCRDTLEIDSEEHLREAFDDMLERIGGVELRDIVQADGAQ